MDFSPDGVKDFLGSATDLEILDRCLATAREEQREMTRALRAQRRGINALAQLLGVDPPPVIRPASETSLDEAPHTHEALGFAQAECATSAGSSHQDTAPRSCTRPSQELPSRTSPRAPHGVSAHTDRGDFSSSRTRRRAPHAPSAQAMRDFAGAVTVFVILPVAGFALMAVL